MHYEITQLPLKQRDDIHKGISILFKGRSRFTVIFHKVLQNVCFLFPLLPQPNPRIFHPLFVYEHNARQGSVPAKRTLGLGLNGKNMELGEEEIGSKGGWKGMDWVERLRRTCCAPIGCMLRSRTNTCIYAYTLTDYLFYQTCRVRPERHPVENQTFPPWKVDLRKGVKLQACGLKIKNGSPT